MYRFALRTLLIGLLALTVVCPAAAVSETVTETPERNTSVSFTYEGERITVLAESNQTIRGQSNLDPGAEIHIQIRATGTDHPFLKTAELKMPEEQTFSSTFNFSDVPPNTPFEVHVFWDTEHDLRRIAEGIEGRVVNESMLTPTPTIEQTSQPDNSPARTDTIRPTTETAGQSGFGLVVASVALASLLALDRR